MYGLMVLMLLVPLASPQAQGEGSPCTPEAVADTTTILLDTYNFISLFSFGWTSVDRDGDGMRVRKCGTLMLHATIIHEVVCVCQVLHCMNTLNNVECRIYLHICVLDSKEQNLTPVT